MLGGIVAAVVAGAVTYLEIDQVFSLPEKSPEKWGILGVCAAFVAVNALLAVALYALLDRASVLSGVDESLAGLLVGAGYLSLVRLKFATVNEQPFGFEFFYDLAREFAYRRINRRLIRSRNTAAKLEAEGATLADLAAQANLYVRLDSLISQEERAERQAWILGVIQDNEASEDEKKLILADFLRSGSQSAHD